MPRTKREWLTRKQVADILGISESTVIRLVEEGELVEIDLRAKGAQYHTARISRESLTEMIQRRTRRVEGTPQAAGVVQ